MSNILTKELLETKVSAKEYLPWVRGLISSFKENDPEGLKNIRLRIGLAKELMQEAFPIGLFAEKYFQSSDDVEISLKVGNQNFDAEVFDKRAVPSGISYLEVTMATEGENDFLRMKKLHEEGEVSGVGKVTKSGTKKTGLVVEVENEMVSQKEILNNEKKLVSEAIERKLGKKYPDNTALIIGFDDTMAFDRRDNIANIQSTIDQYCSEMHAFNCIAVVGLVENLFLLQSPSKST